MISIPRKSRRTPFRKKKNSRQNFFVLFSDAEGDPFFQDFFDAGIPSNERAQEDERTNI
jgi:hypothetical protein